jgi:hypothetical protein
MLMTDAMWTALGWCGTVIFVGSFLVKDRSVLHLLGMVGSIVKLIYTWHYALWPLVTNWALLIAIEAVQWWRYKNDHNKPSVEECVRCSQ